MPASPRARSIRLVCLQTVFRRQAGSRAWAFAFCSGPRYDPATSFGSRALAEIQQTLDADGTLDKLPFMPEMEAYCGRRFRVHRRVDKVNDMRKKTGLRRMRSVVTLTSVRCNGAQHGGCQAQCQILWKDAWLERTPSDEPEQFRPPGADPSAPSLDQSPAGTYFCQMTRLWEASQSMSRFDLRQDARPLLNGNISHQSYMSH